MPASHNKSPIYTVSELNKALNDLMRDGLGTVQLVGEISQFTAARSGHWYFTLKDNKEEMSSAMFKGANSRVDFTPVVGMQVEVAGNLNLYGPSGRLSLVVSKMSERGEGDLHKEFERLRARLQDEGLFDRANKLEIPSPPKCIGVITSKQGAALQDILSTLQRRAPMTPIRLFSSLVQGEGAPVAIQEAIQNLQAYNLFAPVPCDLIILARGGGSKQDLWAFNDESLIRSLHRLNIPCISGVGHESDTTLADFVCDYRAETPTAAAEKASEVQVGYQQEVLSHRQALQKAAKHQFTQVHVKLQNLAQRLYSPRKQLTFSYRRLDDLEQSLTTAMHAKFNKTKQHVGNLNSLIVARGITIKTSQQELQTLSDKLSRAIKTLKDKRSQTFAFQQSRIQSHQIPISTALRQTQLLADRLVSSIKIQHVNHQERLQATSRTLEALAPYHIQKRGYAIISSLDKSILTSSSAVASQGKVIIHMHDGKQQASIDHLSKTPAT